MKLRKCVLLSVSHLIVLLLGALAGSVIVGLRYTNLFLRQAGRAAESHAGREMSTLTRLRLGEIDELTADLEMRVDGNIVSVSLAPQASKTDRQRRLLRAWKTYRDIYPCESDLASEVTQALKGVRRMGVEDFPVDCSLPFCRLVKRTTTREAR